MVKCQCPALGNNQNHLPLSTWYVIQTSMLFVRVWRSCMNISRSTQTQTSSPSWGTRPSSSRATWSEDFAWSSPSVKERAESRLPQVNHTNLYETSWSFVVVIGSASHWCVCCLSVIPQHSTDAYLPSSSTVSISSNGEDLNAAAYYERLKILRQRRGLENSTVCLLLTWVNNCSQQCLDLVSLVAIWRWNIICKWADLCESNTKLNFLTCGTQL